MDGVVRRAITRPVTWLDRRASRRLWLSLSAPVIYLALSFGWNATTWASPTTRSVGAGGDSYVVMWSLAWWPHALAHGMNPFLSHAVNQPHGVNLMWQTSQPLVALVLAPVTYMFGPVAAYNLFATLAPALNASAARLAFRRWTGTAGAAIGGFVFGFSPAVAAQSSQHPFLTLMATAPLLLVVLDRILVLQHSSPWRDGLLLGGLVIVQILINEEILAMETVIAAVAAGYLVVRHRDLWRSRVRYAVRAIGIAGAVTAVVCAVPLAEQFLGPDRFSGQIHPAAVYSADLLNLVVPTKTALIVPTAASRISGSFTGNWTEWGFYLGPTLVLLVVVALAVRRPLARFALLLTVVPAVLALGPSLHVDGTDTHLPLPFAALTHVPVLMDLLPTRFAGMMFLGVGLCAALMVDALPHWTLRTRVAGLALLAVSVTALLPTLPYDSQPVPEIHGLQSVAACPARVRNTVAILPAEDYALLWQASAHFCYATVEPIDFNVAADTAPYVDFIANAAVAGDPLPAPSPGITARLRHDCDVHGISAIILGPTPPPAQPSSHLRLRAWISAVLHEQPLSRGNILIWVV